MSISPITASIDARANIDPSVNAHAPTAPGAPEDLDAPPTPRASAAREAGTPAGNPHGPSSPTIASGTMRALIEAQASDAKSAPSNTDIHNMTNQEMLDYATSHQLKDVALSFTLDYLPADLSPAGQAAFRQTLMSDPTKHDFVKLFRDAADGARSRGDMRGEHYFDAMMESLIPASAKDASERKTKNA